MPITTRKLNNYAVIEVASDWTAETSDAIKADIFKIIDAGNTNILLNLNYVGDLTSDGMSLIPHIWMKVSELSGSIFLVIGKQSVRDAFKKLKLEKIIKVFSSEEEFKQFGDKRLWNRN